MAVVVTEAMVADYQRDGTVLVRGLWADWVDVWRAGVAHNKAEPSEYGAENTRPGKAGRFFDDYCNWQRIPEFAEVIGKFDVAKVAAALMGSSQVQLFHDHVLVKEPGALRPTPWHQDRPCYFVQGRQTVRFWSPLGPGRPALRGGVASVAARGSAGALAVGYRVQSVSRKIYVRPRPQCRPDAGAGVGGGAWATRWRSTLARCTAREAMSAARCGGRARCDWLEMSRDTTKDLAAPRHRFEATECRRNSGCARTGSRCCGHYRGGGGPRGASSPLSDQRAFRRRSGGGRRGARANRCCVFSKG